MAWFRCFIRGEGFPGELADCPGLVGFYTARFVEAENPEAAEWRGLELLKADERLAPPPGYTPTGRARVFFEEITEVPAEAVPEGRQGFIFFPMEDEPGPPGP